MSNNKKKLKILLRVFFVAVVVFVLLRSQDMGQVKEIILGVKPLALLISIFIFWFSATILAMRWYILLKSQKIRIPFYSAVKVNFLGLFYNNFLFSSIGGDLLRGWYITHHTTKKLEAAFSVVVDRMIGLLMIVLMAAISFPFVLVDNKNKEVAVEGHNKFDLSAYLHQHSNGIIFSIVISIALLAILLSSSRFRQNCNKFLNKLLSIKTKILQAIKLYIRSPFTVLLSMLATSIAQISTIIAIFILGHSMGIEIPLKYYFVVFPVGWLVSAVPVTPGGIGVFELGIVAMFSFVPEGSKEVGLALALCQRVLYLLGSIPGAVIHLSGAHAPKTKEEFSIDSESIIN